MSTSVETDVVTPASDRLSVPDVTDETADFGLEIGQDPPELVDGFAVTVPGFHLPNLPTAPRKK